MLKICFVLSLLCSWLLLVLLYSGPDILALFGVGCMPASFLAVSMLSSFCLFGCVVFFFALLCLAAGGPPVSLAQVMSHLASDPAVMAETGLFQCIFASFVVCMVRRAVRHAYKPFFMLSWLSCSVHAFIPARIPFWRIILFSARLCSLVFFCF